MEIFQYGPPFLVTLVITGEVVMGQKVKENVLIGQQMEKIKLIGVITLIYAIQNENNVLPLVLH